MKIFSRPNVFDMPARLPMNVLNEPLKVKLPASSPKKEFELPEVILAPAEAPKIELDSPVVCAPPEFLPTKILLIPEVRKTLTPLMLYESPTLTNGPWTSSTPRTSTVSTLLPRTTALLLLTTASAPIAVAKVRLSAPTFVFAPTRVRLPPAGLPRPAVCPRKTLSLPIVLFSPADCPKKELR